MARRILLTSPLAPDAIARKMKDVLGDRSAKPVAGVTGNGSEQTMTLFYFRPNIENSFQTSFVATLEPAGSGTRIKGRMGVPRSARVFMVAWFGFLAVFMALAGGGTIAAGASLLEALPFLAIPLGMMAFGVLLYGLGTWSSKADEAAILEFLAKTVSARPA